MRLFPNRKSDNERAATSSFMFWRWFDIIPRGETEVYLARLNVLSTPWFGIKLHWINRPDQDRDLHDHPWSFLSILLWGNYDEVTPAVFEKDGRWFSAQKTRRIRWFNFKRAPAAHRISRVSRRVVTLVINGPKTRDWGFYTADGWVRWDRYVNA